MGKKKKLDYCAIVLKYNHEGPSVELSCTVGDVVTGCGLFEDNMANQSEKLQGTLS